MSDRSRLTYYIGFPLVTFALCGFAYFLGYTRGRMVTNQASQVSDVAVPAVPPDHAKAPELTFFKTLRDSKETSLAAAPTPVPQVSVTTDEPAPQDGMAIQVSAFKDIGKAHELSDDLKNRGYPAFVRTTKEKKGEWHKVYVGPYQDRTRADAILSELSKDGFHSGFVSHVSHP